MMRYVIRHETRFEYDAPVQFARCNLRLRPIDWPGQTVSDFLLTVEPGGMVTPAQSGGMLAHIDRLIVADAVAHLSITATANVVVNRPVPLIKPDDLSVASVRALARQIGGLDPFAPAQFLYPSPMIPLDAAIAAWCAPSLSPDQTILEAGMALAREIQQNFTFDPHATVTGTPPRHAFDQRSGVCQDFAQIMIAGLRAAGLPAAYASGYLRTLPPPGQPRLVGADAMHAWVMLWCGPERGWIGLDPTNGIYMAEDHILVAIGRDYADIAPVDGIFTGYGAQDVRVAVDVEPVDMAA